MLSLSSLITLLIISFYTVNGDTDNCNYVVDYFWTAVRAPTVSPTDSPSPSPTNAPTPAPTLSPTKSPLAAGETLQPSPSPTSNNNVPTQILIIPKPNGDGDGIDPDESILKPMTFDYCYSFPNTKFYNGDFSLKYQCNSDNHLTRQIYYNTLQCDSSDQDVLSVQQFQMGTYGIKYVCNQQQNCQFAKFVNATANTPSPTPAPSDDPTRSPTPAPTLSPTAGPTHIGTEYPSNYPSWISYANTPTQVMVIGGGGENGHWWEQCDGITAGSDSSNEIISYFPQNICVQANFFDNVFYYTYADVGEYYGWYCDTNNPQKYFMGIFTDSECTILKEYGTLIEYENNKCIPKPATNNYYRAYWTYIECSVRDGTNVFTPSISPNEPQTPTTSPGMSPVASPVPTTSPGMSPTVSPVPATSPGMSPATSPVPAITPTDHRTNGANSMVISFIHMIGIILVVQFIM